MAYTVKKLATISGVSVRALHWHDEVGLLKPAYHGVNGYRYYEEEQLLMLQQIIFFKELGFELKEIQKILGRDDFDKIAALSSHRQVLSQDLEKKKKLIQTIDKTIEHLKGNKKMKEEEFYEGITKEKQAEYEVYLKNRFGEDHPSFVESKKNMQYWTDEKTEQSKKEIDAIMKAVARLVDQQMLADSEEVQKVVKSHYVWLKQFWTPTKESYTELGLMYTEFEWKKFFSKYDANHPRLALFLAEGMKVFAKKELS